MTALLRDQKLSSVRNGNEVSAHFSKELRHAHDALIATIEVMDCQTRQSSLDQSAFARARWRISQASLVRRTLWYAIFRHLSPRVSSTDTAELERLAEADRQMLRHSADHISKWTPDKIKADWSGYCQASRTIRWRMKACLGAERRVLYPLLDRDAA